MCCQTQIKKIFLAILLFVSFFSILACTYFSRRLVFQPHKIDSIPEFPINEPFLKQIWIETDQGKVEGWLFPGKGADKIHPAPAVMIAHGNQELIDIYLDRAKRYRNMGFTVLLCEYRGYGRSDGTPSRNKIDSDFEKFYDFLLSLSFVDAKHIVFHGRSLGGSVLSELSIKRQAAAIIVESSFTSIKEMASGAPDVFISDKYDTQSALSYYHGPVLIIHGTHDKVVPVQHAYNLKQSTLNAKLILYDFGHSDGPPDWEVYWKDIAEFLKSIIS